jgi:hypothetical protein
MEPLRTLLLGKEEEIAQLICEKMDEIGTSKKGKLPQKHETPRPHGENTGLSQHTTTRTQ